MRFAREPAAASGVAAYSSVSNASPAVVSPEHRRLRCRLAIDLHLVILQRRRLSTASEGDPLRLSLSMSNTARTCHSGHAANCVEDVPAVVIVGWIRVGHFHQPRRRTSTSEATARRDGVTRFDVATVDMNSRLVSPYATPPICDRRDLSLRPLFREPFGFRLLVLERHPDMDRVGPPTTTREDRRRSQERRRVCRRGLSFAQEHAEFARVGRYEVWDQASTRSVDARQGNIASYASSSVVGSPFGAGTTPAGVVAASMVSGDSCGIA